MDMRNMKCIIIIAFKSKTCFILHDSMKCFNSHTHDLDKVFFHLKHTYWSGVIR